MSKLHAQHYWLEETAGGGLIFVGGGLVSSLEECPSPVHWAFSCPTESGLSATLYFGGSLAEIISYNTTSPINLTPLPAPGPLVHA